MVSDASGVRMPQRLRSAVRGSTLYAPIRRWRLARLTRQPGAYPDWHSLLADHQDRWTEARARAAGPRVLIASSLGLHFTVNTIDSLLALALTLRGARVEILLCDGALPACQVVDHTLAPSVQRFAERGPQPDFCDACWGGGSRTFAALGLPVHRLSSWAHPSDREECAVDEHANAGALRFFGKQTLSSSPIEQKVLQRYASASRISALAAQRLLGERAYDVVVAHHGIYVPQGPIAEAALEAGSRLVTWHTGSRRKSVIMEHGDTYHRTMMSEPEARWNARPLTPGESQRLAAYLESRADGPGDWITFQRQRQQSRGDIEKALGLSYDIPTALLVGSVAWDARIHYPQNAYAGMFEWAEATIQHFMRTPDRQLIVRCHPGEHLNSPKAGDQLERMLRERFPSLPANIRIVAAENPLNTYALAKHSAAILVYNSKMGVELSARGRPVIVAGDAWIRGKGFSYDTSTPAEYLSLLEAFPDLGDLGPEQRQRAERYAFHFFFRRHVRIGPLEERGWPLCSLSENAFPLSLPGADSGMDTVCTGILTGAPFEMPSDAPW